MNRIAIVSCLIICVGCSGETDLLNEVGRGGNGGDATEDGGMVENPDRDKAEAYLVSLGRVQSAEDERKLLAEFGEWLRAKGYRIRVERKEDRHVLSCPEFPPVTPWTDHSFLDARNLALLPRFDDGG